LLKPNLQIVRIGKGELLHARIAFRAGDGCQTRVAVRRGNQSLV
jgi:hypothetical protein